MQTPLFSVEQLRSIYRSKWVDPLLRRRAKQVVRKSRLAEYLPRGGLFLDLGGGTGHIAQAVIDHSAARRCVTTDLWRPSLRMRNRLAASGSHAVTASAMCLPFRDGSFDGGWLAFVLHHIDAERQLTVLSEARRVLKPGGVFVLIEDTPDNAEEAATVLKADRRLNFETEAAPHHYRSPAEWKHVLAVTGFSVVGDAKFSRLFPPATLKPVPHHTFVCRR